MYILVSRSVVQPIRNTTNVANGQFNVANISKLGSFEQILGPIRNFQFNSHFYV